MNPENLKHVLRMVLGDNKGQVLTEAMCLGLESAIVFYMNTFDAAEKRDEQLPGVASCE